MCTKRGHVLSHVNIRGEQLVRLQINNRFTGQRLNHLYADNHLFGSSMMHTQNNKPYHMSDHWSRTKGPTNEFNME
jgi:hypothetical protein